MRKNIVLIVLVVVIVIGGFWAYSLFSAEQREMAGEPLSDFQIKDTANVYKIIITEKDLGTITLNRGVEDSNWYIDDSKLIAQPYNVNLILETAFQIQVKQNVSEKLKENVLTQLSIRHKKVEFYYKGEDKPRKTWYVGNGTSDHTGTFMLLDLYDPTSGKTMRSPDPFIMYKPGVQGTLDSRFFSDKEEWMLPGVFNYNLKNIASIKVENNEQQNETYRIDILDNGKVSLFNNLDAPVIAFDTNEVRHYVTHYKDLYYESFAKELDNSQKDSVLNSLPHYSITVTENNGQKKKVNVWKIKVIYETEGIGLTETSFDTGRAYINIDGGKDLMKIQYFSWDVVFKPLSYFLPKKVNPFQY